ncbi:hypothetical protein KY321_05170 [Candidatus Woesearchaeota archaeon]|nr:hypothetical protein [Candidatus Woesearchaeota archaeon]
MNKYGIVSTPVITLSKPDSLVQIVFLGGSLTASMGVNLDDNETWSWKTVEALKNLRINIKFDFINTAQGAYTSFDSYGRLWSRISFF